MFEILKTDARSVFLESYTIDRGADDHAVKVWASLLIRTPSMVPAEMRIHVEYDYDDIPNASERDLARRLLELIRNRVQ